MDVYSRMIRRVSLGVLCEVKNVYNTRRILVDLTTPEYGSTDDLDSFHAYSLLYSL